MFYIRIVIKTILLSLFFTGIASAADVFTEKNISAYGQGKTTKEAKESAVLSGEKEAFQKIILRLYPEVHPDSIQKISSQELIDMVQAIEVRQEKMSPTNYSAVLDVSFNPSALKRFMQNNGISSSIAENTTSVLLLPILYQNGVQDISLNNSWNMAWIKYLQNSGTSTNFVVPTGNAEDNSYLDLSNEYPLKVINAGKLKLLAQKYHADKIILIEDKFETEQKNMEISIRQILPENPGTALIINFDQADLSDNSLTKTISDIAATIENKKEISAPLETSHISVLVPFSGLQEWSTLSQKLRSTSSITKIDQRKINVSSAFLDIYYNGSIDILQSSLAERGLAIESHNDSYLLTTISKNNTNQSQ